MTRSALLTSTAVALLAGLPQTAEAVTFDLSTLNVNGVTGRSHICPCVDPITGTTIFTGAAASQYNGWTMGTDGGAATLYFAGEGRGNNAGKLYIPSGGPGFPVPAGQSIGSNNTQYTGDYALSNGFPLYFWFGVPGSAFVSPAVGSPVQLDSLWLSNGSGALTITGYSDLGVTVANVMTVALPGGSTPFQVTFDPWNNIEQVNITGGSGFYVNDIEVNDVAAVPGPVVGAGLPGLFALGLFGLARLRRKLFAA